MVLGCLLLSVGRSKEALAGFHAVVVPLWGDECVAKEFAVLVVGEAVTFCRQGMVILERNRHPVWEFDPNKG